MIWPGGTNDVGGHKVKDGMMDEAKMRGNRMQRGNNTNLLPPKLQRRGLVFKGKMVTMQGV